MAAHPHAHAAHVAVEAKPTSAAPRGQPAEWGLSRQQHLLTAAGALSTRLLAMRDSMPLSGPLVLNRLMPFASSSFVDLAAASRSTSLGGAEPAGPGVRLLALSRCRNGSRAPP